MVPEWARATFAVLLVIAAVVAYRNGAARPTTEDRERGRRLGAILMLLGGATSLTTIGTIFAERSPEDPAPLAAWFLLCAAMIMGLSGAMLRMGARVRPKVRPSDDSVRSSESVADDESREPFSPTPQGPPLASRATSSAIGRLVRLLLPFALIAVVMNVTSRWIEPTDDAPPTVVPTGDRAGLTLGGRAVDSPPGVEPAYSFVVPEGWMASSRFVRAPLQAIDADLVLTRVRVGAEAVFVGRLRRVAADEPLPALLPAITKRLRATESGPAVVDGEAAAVLDMGVAGFTYSQAAVTVRDGAVVVVVSFATQGDGTEARAVLGAVLESWSWE